MPMEHLFYIPMVFTLGLSAGFALSLLRRPTTQAGRYEGVSGWWVAAALLATAVIFALTHVIAPFGGVHSVTSAAHGSAILDQQPAFTSAEIYARLDAFGALGRQAYQQMTYTSDVLFPLSLLVSLVLLGSYLARRSGASPAIRRSLIALPASWFLFDMAENAVIYSLIRAYPQQLHWAPVLGPITALKFGLLLLSIMAIAAVGWRRWRSVSA